MKKENDSNHSSILERYLANLSIKVEPFAVCQLDRAWRLSLPGPPCAMLHFVVRGDGWLTCKDGTHKRIGENWVIVIPKGIAHSLETKENWVNELTVPCLPDEPPVHYIVAGETGQPEMTIGCGTLNIRHGEALGLFDHLKEILVIDLSEIPGMSNLFKIMMDEQSNDSPGKPVIQGAIMTQLLVYMLRTLGEQSDSNLTWLKALDDSRLARAIDHILDDPSALHSVESLADVACMSRSSFSKHFHDAFSSSPMALVNHVRLERAAKMLCTGHASIEQIAQRVGFSSRSHFSRAFKSHTGISPASYNQL